MSKRVLIVGLGRFGLALARELWHLGAEIVAIDEDEALLQTLQGKLHAAFVADGTDTDVLQSAGVGDIDTAVVGIGEQFEAAVLCVAALHKLGVKEIVARATTSGRADVLRAVGATRVHEVEKEMGQRAAIAIITPVAADLLDFASQFRVIPWTACGSLVGQSLATCGLRDRYNINVIGVRPAGSAANTLVQPAAGTVIGDGDTLLLVGEEVSVGRFVSEVGS